LGFTGCRQGDACSGRKRICTYSDLGVRLQGKCSQLGLLFISGGKRDGVLRANAQRELLAAGGDTGDGLEACLQMCYGPRGGYAPLGR